MSDSQTALTPWAVAEFDRLRAELAAEKARADGLQGELALYRTTDQLRSFVVEAVAGERDQARRWAKAWKKAARIANGANDLSGADADRYRDQRDAAESRALSPEVKE